MPEARVNSKTCTQNYFKINSALHHLSFFPDTAAMKVKLCSLSRYKIYPGRGRCYARTDGKVFQFLNVKCESAFLSKRNPWQINWTVLYRRKHKKGQSDEIQKKRTHRAVKFQRAITGASLSDIMAKRNQKPEVRKAQENKLARLPRKQKRLSKHLKRQQCLLLRLPQKRHLSKRLWSLWRFLLLVLVENAKLVNQIFK